MSLRGDARDCLIQALHDRKNLDVTPEQLNKFKPSDPQIGTLDGFAWLEILEAGTACMRSKGHPMGKPAQKEADDLLDQLLIESQLYLEHLAKKARRQRSRLSQLMFVGGAIAAVGTIALAVRAIRRRRR